MMAEQPATTQTTEAPNKKGGFPPFDTTTFPSQLFWLVVTFAFLFTVLWRVTGPKINSAITNRRGAINGAIQEANAARNDAQAAQASYEAALASARAKANALAEETRQGLNAEIAKAKADADAAAHQAMHDADARIAQTQVTAKAAVGTAARDAAIAIVEHLTGDKVSADDATKAMGN
jgi:F-type H+-transporting ATPase subunit b